MSPGEKLSRLRKSKGLSQELLAEQSHVSLRTIQRIEAAATTPRPSTLKILAETLGTTLEDFGFAEVKPVDDAEVFAKLRLLNFSALLGLLIPLSNIFLPLLIWRKNNQHSLINERGRKIISFQIIWTLTTIILVFGVPTIQYLLVQSYVIGRFPPTIIIVYSILLILNLLCTLHTAAKLHRRDSNLYPFIPSLF